MTRDFPDELLSAFLDNELSPADRAMVEKHLASSEADRLLLAELKALRGEVAALPGVAVKPSFTDRVVQAAIAEAQRPDATAATGAPTPLRRSRSSGHWLIGAAAASAAALAACFLLVVQPWRGNDPVRPIAPLMANVPGPLVQALQGTVPGDNETVVLRLKAGQNTPLTDALNAALAKAGIAGLGSDYVIGAADLENVYRNALEARFATSDTKLEGPALLEATLAAAQAVFVEAPLTQLDEALAELASGYQQPLNLQTGGTLAFVRTRQIVEGEPGSSAKKFKLPPAGQPFAQQLEASHFRLEKKVADAANILLSQQPAAIDPQQLVRVLILIEAE